MRRESHVRFREGAGVQLPRATRLVVCCRQAGEQVRTVVTEQLQGLGLALNATKTRTLDARHQAFTFLGFTVRLARSRRTGGWFPLARPSASACQRLRDKVKALTSRDRASLPTPVVIAEVNRVVQGWAGYFHFKNCTRAFGSLQEYVAQRVRIYLRRKHRRRGQGYRAFPNAYLYGTVGLYHLPTRAPWTAPAHASR